MHRFIRKIDSLFRRAQLVDSLPRIKSDCISVAVLWSIIRIWRRLDFGLYGTAVSWMLQADRFCTVSMASSLVYSDNPSSRSIFCNFDKDLWTLHIHQLSYHISPLSQQWYIVLISVFLAFIFGSQPFSLKRLISYLWPYSCLPPLSAHSDLAYLPQGITGKTQFIAQAFCLLSATIATSAPSHSAHSPEDLDQYMLLRNSTGRTMMEFPPANGETVTEHGRELHPEELKIPTAEEKKMHRLARPTEKQEEKLENGPYKKPNANEDRPSRRISTIDSMDNGTMVEAFKYLNYCQLAKNSRVSMRFRNVIQTHRHKLALLYVHIDMIKIAKPVIAHGLHAIKIFNQELSIDAYDEWVIRNKYSKEVTLEDQVAQNVSNGYHLRAYACYDDSRHRILTDRATVFSASVKLNHENWPLFQHFVRLATDPFIYINCMELTYQRAVLNSLAGAVNPNRLQCKEFYFDHRGNIKKPLTWTKNHVRCNELCTYGKIDLKQDEALLDFFVTGGNCTSAFEDKSYACLSKAAGNFVQKFIDLKSLDEIQLVHAIKGNIKAQAVESLKRNYAKFVVEEERHEHRTKQIFEFTNNEIGKKLQLTTTNIGYDWSYFSIKINHL